MPGTDTDGGIASLYDTDTERQPIADVQYSGVKVTQRFSLSKPSSRMPRVPDGMLVAFKPNRVS